MNHTDLLTNQGFLKELEKRLPNFNNDELIFLGQIMIALNPRGEEILKYFKENYPETHNLIQETTQKLEKKVKELEIEKIKEAVRKNLKNN